MNCYWYVLRLPFWMMIMLISMILVNGFHSWTVSPTTLPAGTWSNHVLGTNQRSLNAVVPRTCSNGRGLVHFSCGERALWPKVNLSIILTTVFMLRSVMHWSQTAQPVNRAEYKSEIYGTENNQWFVIWTHMQNLFRELTENIMNGPTVCPNHSRRCIMCIETSLLKLKCHGNSHIVGWQPEGH